MKILYYLTILLILQKSLTLECGCEEGKPCCVDHKDDFKCCPYENGTCCKDRLNCCPKGYKCDCRKNICKKTDDLLFLTEESTPMKPLEIPIIKCLKDTYREAKDIYALISAWRNGDADARRRLVILLKDSIWWTWDCVRIIIAFLEDPKSSDLIALREGQ